MRTFIFSAYRTEDFYLGAPEEVPVYTCTNECCTRRRIGGMWVSYVDHSVRVCDSAVYPANITLRYLAEDLCASS